MTISATQKGLDALCLPDALYLAGRLASCRPAGVLSRQRELDLDYEGAALCYATGGAATVVAKVESHGYRGIMYMTGAAAVEALQDVIGPNQAAEYVDVPGAVFLHKLRLREYYGQAGMPSGLETAVLAPDGVVKSRVNLETAPTAILYAAFKALESKLASGGQPAAAVRESGREIAAVLQKRLPALVSESPLLADDPEPASVPVLSKIAIVSKGTKDDSADSEWMYVLSMVLEPNDGKDGAALKPDYDGEIYDRHLIRKIAFPYVQKYRGLGIMHEGAKVSEDVARVVQSYVVDDGFTLTDSAGKVWGSGTWFLGAEVKRDSDLGKKIESGEIGAWSIDGIALKVPEKVAA